MQMPLFVRRNVFHETLTSLRSVECASFMELCKMTTALLFSGTVFCHKRTYSDVPADLFSTPFDVAGTNFRQKAPLGKSKDAPNECCLVQNVLKRRRREAQFEVLFLPVFKLDSFGGNCSGLCRSFNAQAVTQNVQRKVTSSPGLFKVCYL